MLQNVIEHFFMDKKCGCLAEYLDGESDQTQKDVVFACAKLIADSVK